MQAEAMPQFWEQSRDLRQRGVEDLVARAGTFMDADRGVAASPSSAKDLIPPTGILQLPPKGIRLEIGEGPQMERENKLKLLNRLSRIEGQVRGVSRMVDEGRYCIDVLTQLQAVRAALVRVETELLKDHLGHCIEGAIVSGDKAEQRSKAAELIELLERSTR